MRRPENRRPTSPGEMLVEEFLAPTGMTAEDLAKKMGVPPQRVLAIVSGEQRVDADSARLLAEALGTTPELWMNLQKESDL